MKLRLRAQQVRVFASVILALAVLGLLAWLILVSVRAVWEALVSVNASLAVALITAAATIMAATITVTLGRYFERKREIEAHFRAEKTKIYDEFLREIFKMFHSPSHENVEVEFLRDWQRKIIIWGGRDVLRSYVAWQENLKQPNPTAQTIFLMDDFFRALRSDIGQSSNGLQRGFFGSLILRHGSLFLTEAAKNPSMTLEELAELEKRLLEENRRTTPQP